MKELVSILHDRSTGLPVKYAVELIEMAWNACISAAVLRSIQNVLLTYVFYNNQSMIFEVIDAVNKDMLAAVVNVLFCTSSCCSAGGWWRWSGHRGCCWGQ